VAESHTNFVYFELGDEAEQQVADMTAEGVIIRGMGGGWVRVTIGNDLENRRFLEALDTARVATDSSAAGPPSGW
jgi:histidinol-phosphate/aromatic aminotransferase/cobyric acid decarboxylase-like protein